MKKKNFIIIVSIAAVFIFLAIGIFFVSYGYVTSDIIDQDGKGKYFVVENLRIEYSDGTETLLSKQDGVFIPGATITKTFTVKNTGSKELDYNIIFTDIVNTFNRKNDIVYEIYNNEELLLSSGIFPNEMINYIVGDINLDKVINEDDYIKFNNFVNNNGYLNTLEMLAADLNLDNTIDENDNPLLIKKYIDYINDESLEKEELITNIGNMRTTNNVETILDNQKLNVNETATYVLKINYLNSEENQIEDSGKSINAKISFEQNN